MAEIRKRFVCSNRCGDEFFTTAHVVEEWKVDGLGNWIETTQALETSQKPNDENIWTCAKCNEEAFLFEDSYYEGAFEYGGYYFRGYKVLLKTLTREIIGIMNRVRSDIILGFSKYEWGKRGYTYEGFYAASGKSDYDVFECIETGKVYLPGENELFEYIETQEERRATVQ